MMLSESQRDLLVCMCQPGEDSFLFQAMLGEHDSLLAGLGQRARIGTRRGAISRGPCT